MRIKTTLIAMAAIVVGAVAPSAFAAGCLKGAMVGGVAGHVAGHHAVMGAIAGCAVGHHMAAKQRRGGTAPPSGRA